MSHRLLVILLIWICLGQAIGAACDYTVRDIGFVPLEKPQYTLVVLCTNPSDDSTAADREKLAEWGLALLTVPASSADAIPSSISGSRLFQDSITTASVWLVDDRGRSLCLEQTASHEDKLSVDSVLAKHFDTKWMRILQEDALTCFAQIILFDGLNTHPLEEAQRAADSLTNLEAMLPRPISQPAKVQVIPFEDRASEQVLMWSTGIDQIDAPDCWMATVYGRGRMAGPVMHAEEINHRNAVGQLALVGESCECETDRNFMTERAIPFFWSTADSKTAAAMLGFDPADPRVQEDVRQVLARGRNSSRRSAAGDRIEQIVAGYFESTTSGREFEYVAIPEGSKPKPDRLAATVIAGEGWDFEPEANSTEANANEAEDISDNSADKASSPSSVEPSHAPAHLTLVLAVVALFGGLGGAWLLRSRIH